MALLDYLFPPQQSQVGGLLGVDEEKMRQAAQRAGLLNTGLGIIAASGPSRMPQGILQPVASGLMAGQQAYQGAIEQQMADALARRKMLEPKTVSVKGDETVYQINPRTGQPEVFLQGEGSIPADFKKGLALVGLPINTKPQDLTPQQLGLVNNALRTLTPQTNLMVNTEKGYGGALAGKIADQDALRYDIATKAPSVLESVDRSRKLLASGQVFTGALANQKLELAKFGQAIGATGKNTDELVSNTQQLMATRAQATLDSIKASGLGSGQGFTDKDRQFLENARLGNITYSKKALEQQLEIEEKAARGSVDVWNQRVKELPDSATKPLGIGQVTLPKKEAPAPTNIPQGAVQMLQSNPTPQMKEFFDKKYGKGASNQFLQGNR
jgi:hypothetical protein